ncbi:MAG: response regulator [Gammaproteobacteria bacterium]|nr:response regulator [Gammaproteobacteria bacterium]
MKAEDFKRVLIVDDDAIIRETLRILLRGEMFSVVGEAGDGIKAMEMMRKHKPAIVLLDISMPGASGLEVLQEIREKYPKTMVVMISGEAQADTVKAAIENGAVGYIVKPFNMANVMQNLKRALQIGIATAKKAQANGAGKV